MGASPMCVCARRWVAAAGTRDARSQEEKYTAAAVRSSGGLIDIGQTASQFCHHERSFALELTRGRRTPWLDIVADNNPFATRRISEALADVQCLLQRHASSPAQILPILIANRQAKVLASHCWPIFEKHM